MPGEEGDAYEIRGAHPSEGDYQGTVKLPQGRQIWVAFSFRVLRQEIKTFPVPCDTPGR